MDFLRGILKWIVLAIIFIILIVLIVRFANRTETKKEPKEPVVNIVENNNKEEETLENVDSYQNIPEDLVVDSPDTASTALPEVLLGLTIISFGGYYIYKNRTVKENS